MLTVLLLALALSMDAFAAALSQGAAARPAATAGGAVRVGFAFGVAQALMPFFGWALGVAFAGVVREVDHWVAFVLLTVIGGRMVHTGLVANGHDRPPVPLFAGWALFGAAVATSVDAAAAGVTIALLDQPVVQVCAVIGGVAFVLSTVGVLLGRAVGAVAGKRAEVVGGLMLIGLGVRILVEHSFFDG